MRIAQLLERLGQIAPSDKAADWDPVGLQLGDPSAPAEQVAVCHEINSGVAALLKDKAPDLVVTYHPLLFRPQAKIVAGPGPGGRAFDLLQAGVAVAVFHTNFDAAPGGTADSLAEAIGLNDVSPMAPTVSSTAHKIVTFVPENDVPTVREGMAAAGAGVIGNYTQCSFRVAGVGSFLAGEGTSPSVGESGRLNEETESRLEMVAPAAQVDSVVTALVKAHPYEEPAFDVYEMRTSSFVGRLGRLAEPAQLAEFAHEVGARLDATPVRYAGSDGRNIQSVAVVPGSGSSFIGAAQSSLADALLTGDVPHHRGVNAADAGLAIVDPGHTATEKPGVARLLDAVREVAPDVWDLTGGADTWRWSS